MSSLSKNGSSAMSNSSTISTASNKNCLNSNEQPQSKRLKIEQIKFKKSGAATLDIKISPDLIISNEITASNKKNPCSSLSSSANSISISSSSNNSPSSTPTSSRPTTLSQLLNVKNVTNIIPVTETNNDNCVNREKVENILPDLLPTSIQCSTLSTLPKCQKQEHNTTITTSSSHISAHEESIIEMREFEQSLTRQCLCGVSERTLRKPFQSHYSQDINGMKRIANLSEWPTNKLVQFLSNLQLLFDIFLKQNSNGFICMRIMDVCDAIIRNDHNLIDEIIVLASYNNSYVQFLAGRVLASFLVVAKQEMNDNWLKKLVDNLFNFDRLNHLAVQKMHFSLEIIKRIVEWKDIDLHPLEDEVETISRRNAGISTLESSIEEYTDSNSILQTQQPTLETNYFSVHFRSEIRNNSDVRLINDTYSSRIDSNDENLNTNPHFQISYDSSYVPPTSTNQMRNSIVFETLLKNGLDPSDFNSLTSINVPNCQFITLTDSESFDTTHLKCITIKILENKWAALVKNMSLLIANHLDISDAENCILDFLHLWENIISVKANLSIVETLPFYAQLDKFELLLNQNLSCTIYKQMLSLFNEALCYGSTLALQDMLPDETCMLAHQVVRHVKDFRILESLPRRQPENLVSLIGFKRKPIIYDDISLQSFSQEILNNLDSGDAIEMDKTILQKMVLLVLKSIAVTVKEIRSDSSDSSIDSTDYEAFQDMVLIERSIRDALHKLESFMKNTLEFHPECHFSKILIHLFDDQDDHLIEAMVCTLDVTSGISFRNNAFPELVVMLNPIYTFLEFLKMISNSSDLLLDLLVSNETCFLLYLLRLLKYIRINWDLFVISCNEFSMGGNILDEAMSVLIRLRLQISRLVSRQLYPYDISPVLRLLESCESLYEGNELN